MRVQHRLGFRPLPREYRRDAALQNPGLLGGDGFDGVAQEDLVIHVDGRDHGEHRLDYIGRVQPPAQADFDHRRLDAQLAKQPERHGGDGLKVAGMRVEIERPGGLMDHIERPRKLRLRHRDAVDLNTLGGFDQVGRGEQPGADARRPQARGDHGAGGTFAVGPGHVDHAVRLLRIAQGGENRADAVQAQLGGLHFVAQRVQELDGIGIVHVLILSMVSELARLHPLNHFCPPMFIMKGTRFRARVQLFPGRGRLYERSKR